MKGDVYQSFVADSFANNKITMLKGPAGSGKSTTLSCIVDAINKKYDNIINKRNYYEGK